jgi:hypothetical protein
MSIFIFGIRWVEDFLHLQGSDKVLSQDLVQPQTDFWKPGILQPRTFFSGYKSVNDIALTTISGNAAFSRLIQVDE